MTVTHTRTRQQRTSGRNDEKMVADHKQTLFFVVMDALVNILVGEVLTLHCHENGDSRVLDLCCLLEPSHCSTGG